MVGEDIEVDDVPKMRQPLELPVSFSQPILRKFSLNSRIPSLRLTVLNERSPNREGDYVLYWMLGQRRLHSNFALQRAVEWASELGKPLVIFEPIGCRGLWNTDRTHTFVLQGMADHFQELQKAPVVYLPYAEPLPGAARQVFDRLIQQACVVVTDDFPCYIIPATTAAGAKRCPVLMETVDSNGLLPLRATETVFARAYDFRRYLQKSLTPHLSEFPHPHPLQQKKLASCSDPLANTLRNQPGMLDEAALSDLPKTLQSLQIDHSVGPASFAGGRQAAGATLQRFLNSRLSRYAEHRNDPDDEAVSGLSPYLHFGHLSAHEIFSAIAAREEWTPDKLSSKTRGQRENWWGMSPNAESYLDELITWREVGYNFCAHRDDFDQYSSLPEWAQATLAEHQADPRPKLYTLEQLAASKTDDELWNAAQRQLVQEGRMHNYLRMLWGKKILEWSQTPQTACETMIELNNRYAVDGRNPNSYSGIFWVLGRYDRAWGPERPVFGKIRYMSSDNTYRKMSLDRYLEKYGS